ncbi:BON domain-containing protein [Achromobacter arsenitoxydans]|uniref:BON domain-containing protein n=1 Tax=Achromobacter arsenitoxydans TaxID=1147684 RepID=UPI0009DA3B99|nr:BON domain-containing protein [Achromobacter arsenitoxydans]
MNRDPRNPARYSGDREPWRDPAPSFGYQSEGTRQSGSGARNSREPVRSRSADPGQSSYGGFSNEDPSLQRQQVYGLRDRGYDGPTSFGDDEGGYYGDRPSAREEPMSFDTAERGGYGRGMTAWRDRGSRRTDPKGYIRSDERVRENVCESLAHSGLDVSDVSVSVADGKVTLEGTVPNRRMKHDVEDCTVECAGVKDVENRIRVGAAAQAGQSNTGTQASPAE